MFLETYVHVYGWLGNQPQKRMIYPRALHVSHDHWLESCFEFLQLRFEFLKELTYFICGNLSFRIVTKCDVTPVTEL